ncbi:MAG: diguanylate cyclase, partial [Chloroflexota bacterium]
WPAVSKQIDEGARSEMEFLAGGNAYFQAVYLMNLDGEVILSSTDNTGENFTFRPYFQKAVAGNAYISDLSISIDVELPVIYFSVPVKDDTGEIVAVAVLRVLAEEIWSLIAASEEKHKIYSPIVLFDEYGIRLAHSADSSMIFKSVVPLDPAIEAQLQAENRLGIGTIIESTNIPGLAEGILQAETQSHFTYQMEVDPGLYHAGAVRMLTKPWTVIEVIPESVFLSQINQLRTSILMAVIAIGFVSLSVTTLAARSITRPIGIITTAVQNLSAGDLDQPLSEIQPERKDEIGVLARSFESMRKNLNSSLTGLNRHVEELSVLHSIAAASTESTSKDELILKATKIIGSTLSPSNYGVLLLDASNSVLLEHESYLRPREDQPLFQLALGQGFSGTVAKTGEAMRTGDVSKSSVYISANPEIVSELCVPIKTQQHVIGVINLESTEKDAFTLDDERLLQIIAGQLAVGIENVLLFEEVQNLAITDALTGLNNRRFFFEMARKEHARAHRFQHPLVALMLDLDKFKQINESYGHAGGDQALAAVASTWRKELRRVDLMGRYGGDEFIVLLPETKITKGLQVAERLRMAIANLRVETESGQVQLTSSIGVAKMLDDCPSIEFLIDRADRALYQTKQAGGNKVSVIAE